MRETYNGLMVQSEVAYIKYSLVLRVITHCFAQRKKNPLKKSYMEKDFNLTVTLICELKITEGAFKLLLSEVRQFSIQIHANVKKT